MKKKNRSSRNNRHRVSPDRAGFTPLEEARTQDSSSFLNFNTTPGSIRQRHVYRYSLTGFTLLELLLTVAILAVAMSIIYGVLHATLETSKQVEATLHDSEIGPALLNMIRQDLEAVIMPYPDKEYFSGVNKELGSTQMDRLDLVTSTISMGKEIKEQEDERFTSINEVGYQVREDKDRTGMLVLYRREDLFVDDEPLKGGKLTELYDRVKSFDVTYYDGKEWVKEWNNVKNDKKLPEAVKVELTLSFTHTSGEDTERKFETTVVLKQ